MRDLVYRARIFATTHHKDQSYGLYEQMPVHLHDVVGLVYNWGPTYIATAWLHDIVEDTEVTIEEIYGLFPTAVAEAVEIVTDPELPSRREKKLAVNKRFSQTQNRIALLVKLADRLANIRSCFDNFPSSHTKYRKWLEMYSKEHIAFKQVVYRNWQPESWWREIDQAFFILRE